MSNYKSSHTGQQIDNGITKGLSLPTPTAQDEGKVLGIDTNGNYVLITPSSGNSYEEINSSLYGTPSVVTYSGNILAEIHFPTTPSALTKIKFDEPPTDDNDYDSYAQNDTVEGDTSYQNRTKVYVWGASDAVQSGGSRAIPTEPQLPIILNGVTINNVEYHGGTSYSSPLEIILTGNYDIALWGGGGGK